MIGSFFKIITEDMFLLIWEREKHQCKRNVDQLLPVHTLTGDQTYNLGVHQVGIDLTTFWCMGQCSNQLSHQAKVYDWIFFTLWKFDLSIGVFRPLISKMIIDRVGWILSIYVTLFYSLSLFFVSIFVFHSFFYFLCVFNCLTSYKTHNMKSTLLIKFKCTL